jgi:hypothetical protein
MHEFVFIIYFNELIHNKNTILPMMKASYIYIYCFFDTYKCIAQINLSRDPENVSGLPSSLVTSSKS